MGRDNTFFCCNCAYCGDLIPAIVRKSADGKDLYYPQYPSERNKCPTCGHLAPYLSQDCTEEPKPEGGY